MKQLVFTLFMLVFMQTAFAQSKPKDLNAEAAFAFNTHTDKKALEHFGNEKFGVMITWGPVTVTGGEASWSMNNRAVYEANYAKWMPKDFNADDWGDLIKKAGANYIIWVAKHHDGLCLWDTKTTDNNIMNLPYHRNITADIANMCKKYHIDFGAYLSIIDVHDSKWNTVYPHGAKMPGFPEQVSQIASLTERQTMELINEYHPFVLWYDGGWLNGWRSSQYPLALSNKFHKADPKILIARLGPSSVDFESMEAKIGTYRDYPWETVTSVSYPKYSWAPDLKYKKVPYLVETLSRVVCGNGNYLLNFVPDVNGQIPEVQQKIADTLGKWVRKSSAAIFGTHGGPYYPNEWGGSTRKGNKVYLYLYAGAPDSLLLPAIGAKLLSSKVITGGKVNVKQTSNGLALAIKGKDAAGVTIVALTLDNEVKEMIEASNPKVAIKQGINKDLPPIEERKVKV